MRKIKEVLNANKEIKMEIKSLRRKMRNLEAEIKNNCDEFDLDEMSSLSYSEIKELYKEIEFDLSKNMKEKIKDIMKIIKDDKNPNQKIVEVNYFPVLKNIKCIPINLKKQIDNDLRSVSYKNNRLLTKLLNSYKEKYDFYEELINEFIEKEIISPVYVFSCDLCSDEYDEDVVDYKTFKKMKAYWDKEKNNIEITEEEEMDCNYGLLEIDFECDSIEIDSLEEFENKLHSIEYEMVMKPDLTLENI